MISRLLLAIALLTTLQSISQKFEGLAMRPPMGWNSWNTFETKISEQLVKETADIMVSSGMRDAGYLYIVLDDGWMAKERDSISGDLVPDPVKFPGGMKALVDYVHAKGLKFGLYNCAGTKTCAGYPGTRGYEYQDARFYAKLGIDYLKYDWCNTDGITAREAYTTMSNAIKAARRPIVFSLCEWGTYQPWEWAKPVGHLWRTTGDIYPCFDCEFNHGTWSSWGVMRILDMRKNIRQYAGPDHWNDPDMMEVGNGMSEGEDRAHFSLWAMQAAPLIAGNDLRSMSKKTLDILTNKDVIAVDQDPLGIQGFSAGIRDSVETWFKPLTGGDWALCFLNRSSSPKALVADWAKMGLNDTVSSARFDPIATNYRMRNLWTGRAAGATSTVLRAIIPPHDVVLLRLYK
ncbi:MAG: glycoside hydrolase family 27 protein [Chitinophagaceae bacterium]|nr:glycoside hydrolase family 27 protein [Chitinophagaceae bacterium]